MPNIWTHLLFSEEVVDGVIQPTFSSQNESYIKLGSQGPDPFFYYNFWPWIKEEPVHRIGMAIHTRKCGDFLTDLIIGAKEKNEQVKAFVIGFVTHHILDRNTHPYIHYRAGYDGSNHQKLEIIIDTLLAEKFYNLNTWKNQTYKEIDVGRELNNEIVQLLHENIQKHFQEFKQDSTKYIKKSYRDMRIALRILFDPYSWKNKIFGALVSSYSHQPVKDDKDYLNLNHTTWYHPATNEPSNKSFLDLFEESKLEAISIITELERYWSDENKSIEVLRGLVGDISYDTGLPLKLGLENKYSEPIV